MAKKRLFTAWLTEDLHAVIKKYSADLGLSMSAVISNYALHLKKTYKYGKKHSKQGKETYPETHQTD